MFESKKDKQFNTKSKAKQFNDLIVQEFVWNMNIKIYLYYHKKNCKTQIQHQKLNNNKS